MLQLSCVSITIDGKTIVRDLNLSIESGSVHALMGPNGSGKSSLSLTLAGHPSYHSTKPSAITLDTQNLLDMTPEDRAKSGLFLTFQNPIAIPGLTVKQLMKLIVDHLRPEKQSVKDLLSEMKQYASDLHIKPELLDRSVNDNFSGGEKKRIEMLQLLMARPKYAVIDEIDSGLDVDAIKAIGKTINLAKQTFNAGFLMITHYRRILDYVQPDYVHVLAQGKLIKSGGHELIEEIEETGYASFTTL